MEIETCEMAEKMEKLDIHHLALTILELITSKILSFILFQIIYAIKFNISQHFWVFFVRSENQ